MANTKSVIRPILVALGFGVMLYLCALPGDLPASVDTTDGLAGTYSANGVNPNGDEFGGTAVFTATDDPDVFDVQLIITGSIQQGVAILDGNRVDVTWATISSASDDTLAGGGDYVLADDGSLSGTWWVTDGAGTDGGRAGDAVGTIELFPDP